MERSLPSNKYTKFVLFNNEKKTMYIFPFLSLIFLQRRLIFKKHKSYNKDN